MDAVDFKYSLGQGPCLVKYDYTGLGQSFKIVGAFYEHTGIAGSADTGEEAERYADDKGTRTAYDKKCKCPVYPVLPSGIKTHGCHAYKGRQQGKGKCGGAYGRGVDTRKFGYEVLRP